MGFLKDLWNDITGGHTPPTPEQRQMFKEYYRKEREEQKRLSNLSSAEFQAHTEKSRKEQQERDDAFSKKYPDYVPPLTHSSTGGHRD